MRIELAAAEPLVVDPVAVAWDEHGRMYVVEGRGYPTPQPGEPGPGIVALLEDLDGDGVYDKRTEFATGLDFPNGVLCWNGGVIVTCAPDVLYLRDTDGDGVADVRQVLLTGFSTKQSTQLRTSHPTLGLDGWIYVTSGLIGGKVHPLDAPELAVESVSDFRFRLDAAMKVTALEPAVGRGQFGMSFDDFGRRFVCSNRNPAQHIVLTPRQIQRNAALPTDGVQEVAAPGDAARVYPLTQDTTTASFIPALINTPHAGSFTSACGLLVYRGTALGHDRYGNLFICEPAQNLVQRQVVRASGVSFESRRPYEGREFLASTDNWFRPVFAAHGPDGALYICDMYRKAIDHPDYLPKEARELFDFRAGHDRGRIYRIVADLTDGAAKRQRPNATGAPETARLRFAPLTELESPNGWARDTASRLLIESGGPPPIALREMIRSGKAPEARAAALATTEAVERVDDDLLESALADGHPGVREQALRIIGERLTAHSDSAARWLPVVARAAGDADSRVRFQAALALSTVGGDSAIDGLAEIAVRGAGDRWTRHVVLGAAVDRLEFLEAVLARAEAAGDSLPQLLHDLGRVCGAGRSMEEARRLFVRITEFDSAWSDAAVAGLAAGLRARGAAGGRGVFEALVEGAGDEPSAARERMASLPQRWINQAMQAASEPTQRLSAIALLGELAYEQSGAALQSLLAGNYPPEVRLEAVRAIGQLRDPRGAESLVARDHWSAYTPALRTAVVAELLARPAYLPVLFSAVERGDVPVWAIEPKRRDLLLKHKDAAIRQRAEAIFQSSSLADRQRVYEEYKQVLSLTPDPASGRAVFQRACASCHQRGGEGAAVGPDLTGVRNQPAETLLLHIIIPEQEIYPAYTQYMVVTRDGRTLLGLIAAETDESLTLRMALGQEQTLQRGNILSATALDISFMPRELETMMSRQEMADLIGFLKGP